jgi:hypothetical protein
VCRHAGVSAARRTSRISARFGTGRHAEPAAWRLQIRSGNKRALPTPISGATRVLGEDLVMSTEEKKLEPNVAWMFAAAAVVCGIAVSFGLKTANWKVLDAVYTVLFGGLAFASTYLTSAKTMGVWGRFSVAGAAFAVFTIYFVHSALASGDSLGMIPSFPGFDNIVKIVIKAGAMPFAIMMGFFMFLVVSITGLAGAVIGSRIRAGKGYGLIPARR